MGERDQVGYLSEAEVQETVARLEALARAMDSAFVLPGTRIRMGFDALLGIVPVLGDLISQAISSYLIWEAKRLGVSRLTLWRMIGNSAVDTVIGFIPFAGDAFDVAYRANSKNVAILRTHLERRGYRLSPSTEPAGRGPVIEGTATRID